VGDVGRHGANIDVNVMRVILRGSAAERLKYGWKADESTSEVLTSHHRIVMLSCLA
jgi:hypothetical protein